MERIRVSGAMNGHGRRFTRGLAWAAIALSAAPGLSGTQSGPWVEGHIFDAATSREMDDVRVALHQTGRAPVIAYTNVDGSYRLSATGPGTYELIVSRIGYETARFEIDILRPEPARLSIGLVALPVSMTPIEVLGPSTPPGVFGSLGRERPRRSSHVITRAEIEERASNVTTVFDVVRRIHPGWLVARGNPSARTKLDILVYVNGVRRGTTEELRSLPAQGVFEVWFVDALSATQRWGTGHAAGVIHVIMMTTG